MILVTNNPISFYQIKFETTVINTFRKISRLLILLLTLVLVSPFLSGCSINYAAFIASKQNDILQQIDVWAAKDEYGIALDTLNYISDSHPQYQKIQLRKKTLLIEANQYERRIDKQIKQFIAQNQWAKALDLLDQAQENYPQSKSIDQTAINLLQQQRKLLGSIDRNIVIERSIWLIKTRADHQNKLNTDPRNKNLKKELDLLTTESIILSQKLTILAQHAINKKNYNTALKRINQAIALQPSTERQEMLALIKKYTQKSYTRKKQTADKTRKKQQDALIQEIKKYYSTGDLLKTAELIAKLDKKNSDHQQLEELKQGLASAIEQVIQQLLSEANKSYTNGKFQQAIELWKEVLQYDSKNALALTNIQRAENVIDKLTSLREKQQN